MEKEIKNLLESLKEELASRPKIPLPNFKYTPKGTQKGEFCDIWVQEDTIKQNK